MPAVAEPLLELVNARIDAGGFPAIDGLTLATRGEHALVLGAARAVFEAASGLCPVAHGQVRVLGMSPAAALKAGWVAGASLDPRLPPSWTVRTFVAWNARLSGHRRSRLRGFTDEALDRLALGESAKVTLGRAPLVVRRAAVVAGAIATGARLLLVEDPTVNLPDEQGRSFAGQLVRAFEGHGSVVFAARMDLTSPLAAEASEAIVVVGSEIAARGEPAELAAQEHVYALRVHGDSRSFVDAASGRGAKVTGKGGLLTVDVGSDLKVRDLLAIARQTDVTVVEVRPIARALG